MLYNAEGGVINVRDEIAKKPKNTNTNKRINCVKALIHLVFQVICTFSQMISLG